MVMLYWRIKFTPWDMLSKILKKYVNRAIFCFKAVLQRKKYFVVMGVEACWHAVYADVYSS